MCICVYLAPYWFLSVKLEPNSETGMKIILKLDLEPPLLSSPLPLSLLSHPLSLPLPSSPSSPFLSHFPLTLPLSSPLSPHVPTFFHRWLSLRRYTIIFLCLQMLFEVHDLNKDVLEITVFDKDLFSPNGKLSDKSHF